MSLNLYNIKTEFNNLSSFDQEQLIHSLQDMLNEHKKGEQTAAQKEAEKLVGKCFKGETEKHVMMAGITHKVTNYYKVLHVVGPYDELNVLKFTTFPHFFKIPYGETYNYKLIDFFETDYYDARWLLENCTEITQSEFNIKAGMAVEELLEHEVK